MAHATNFRENLRTSSIPIHPKPRWNSSQICRNKVNNSTRTDVQNKLKPNIKINILEAKRDYEDYAGTGRNVFSKNFKIIRKGPFFQDPFFEECRQQFEKSVQEILARFGLTSCPAIETSSDTLNNNGERRFVNDLRSSLTSDTSSDKLKNNVKKSFVDDGFETYRSLRDIQLQDENQAASLAHEDHQHKIVIDVKDFMGGDIKVNSCNNTIRIEGQQDNSSLYPQNSSSSKQTFSKEFILPGLVKMGSVKCALSSDGILSIKVPRSLYMTKSHNIPHLPSQMPNSTSQMKVSQNDSFTKRYLHKTNLPFKNDTFN